MPRVLNIRCDDVSEAVRIDRQTPYGNPFRIGIDGTRKEVIAKYEQLVKKDKKLYARILKLKGKDLACWCSPKACHGDVILRLANKSKLFGG